MTISRREWLLAGSAFMAASVMGANEAMAQGLRPLKFGVGLKAMGPAVINTVIGEILGYNKQEGFTIAPEALGTNGNVQVAIDKGDVDIGIGVPSFGLPLLAKGQWQGALNFYEYTYPYKWDVAVLPDSTIKTYADLKGKRIGVSGFGSTEYPVTQRVLKSMGIDPKTDVTWTAVGDGIQAGIALQRGLVDALAYYDTGFGQIEAGKIKMRFLTRPDDVPMIGGQFLTTRKAFLEKERKLCVGFGRSVAKASVFMAANPQAGASAFLKQYPETAPRGSSAEAAVQAVLFAISRRIKLYTPPYPNTPMGQINPKEFSVEAEGYGFKIADYSNFYTNDLIAEINQFDADQVKAAAKAYPG
ncbi:MAG: ABC transporter substrate-binding protein [Hyphomicrobiales bacterium]|nr:ABC transporter substrate-binding protein [Hyphomicrobiales bacterium]MDE2115289.1 ABC transporter substrate-binding protein [Hyphomicrobiales bacterium]